MLVGVPDGVEVESVVQDGDVNAENGDQRLKNDRKVQEPIAHALLEDRLAANLPCYQIHPLEDNHGGEEGAFDGSL